MNIHEKRKEFYAKMDDLFSLKPKEIQDILKVNGYTSFTLADIREYEVAVMAHMALQQKIIKQIAEGQIVEPSPCPVCEHFGWDGEMIRNPRLDGYAWDCTVGGFKHYIRWRCHTTSGLPLEAFFQHENNEARTQKTETEKEVEVVGTKKEDSEQRPRQETSLVPV